MSLFKENAGLSRAVTELMGLTLDQINSYRLCSDLKEVSNLNFDRFFGTDVSRVVGATSRTTTAGASPNLSMMSTDFAKYCTRATTAQSTTLHSEKVKSKKQVKICANFLNFPTLCGIVAGGEECVPWEVDYNTGTANLDNLVENCETKNQGIANSECATNACIIEGYSGVFNRGQECILECQCVFVMVETIVRPLCLFHYEHFSVIHQWSVSAQFSFSAF